MQVIETNDPVEAQRCRRAQYVGIPTAVTLGGSKFVGLVKSVKQEVGPRWIITIIPKQPKVFALARIGRTSSRSCNSRDRITRGQRLVTL
jgi:hypothetical protein